VSFRLWIAWSKRRGSDRGSFDRSKVVSISHCFYN
jgi:hypothetical protein